jgi:hypothetical protein
LRFVLSLLRHRLIVRGLVGRGIDPRQHIAALDLLALLEIDAYQATVDLRLHGDGIKRAGGANAIEIDRHVGTPRDRGDHRDRAIVAAKAAALALLGAFALRPQRGTRAD